MANSNSTGSTSEKDTRSQGKVAVFATTHWTLVLQADRGACLAINGTWTHTPFLHTVGDWQYVEIGFTAESSTVVVGARLGFWGGDLIGAARFDNLSVTTH